MTQPDADRPDRQATDSAGKNGQPAEGISQFLGKVLEQLSVTAWLPAAMLVGCTAVLTQLRSQGTFNIADALIALTNKPLGILVVLLFSLVIATMVSQAFSFGAIRFWEGYWAGPLLTLGVSAVLIRHKVRRRRKKLARYARLQARAFSQALEKMVMTIPAHVVVIQIQRMQGLDENDQSYPWTDEQRQEADNYNWQLHCSATQLTKLSHAAKQAAEFPAENRILPTRLGNILRKTEDELKIDEGFVMSNRETMPPRLQLHHDQFRNRLDMYCTLIFIYVILSALSLALFVTAPKPMPPVGTVVVAVLFATMAVVSYYAAIASARGYCLALKTVAQTLQSSRPAERQSPSPGVEHHG